MAVCTTIVYCLGLFNVAYTVSQSYAGPYAGEVRGVRMNTPFSLWDMPQSECSKSAIALMANCSLDGNKSKDQTLSPHFSQRGLLQGL